MPGLHIRGTLVLLALAAGVAVALAQPAAPATAPEALAVRHLSLSWEEFFQTHLQLSAEQWEVLQKRLANMQADLKDLEKERKEAMEDLVAELQRANVDPQGRFERMTAHNKKYQELQAQRTEEHRRVIYKELTPEQQGKVEGFRLRVTSYHWQALAGSGRLQMQTTMASLQLTPQQQAQFTALTDQAGEKIAALRRAQDAVVAAGGKPDLANFKREAARITGELWKRILGEVVTAEQMGRYYQMDLQWQPGPAYLVTTAPATQAK